MAQILIESEALDSLKRMVEELERDAELGAKIRKLCDGGQFDLTDSPKSMCSTVIRLCNET